MAQDDRYSWHPIMRSILDHWVWKDRPFSKGQAWVDMILLAQYNPCKKVINGVLIPMEEGQLAWPKYVLAERWGWSRDKVERYLKMLEDDSMIRQQTSQLTTVITLLNYKELRSVAFSKQGNGQGNAQGNGQDNDRETHKSQYKKERSKEGKEELQPAAPTLVGQVIAHLNLATGKKFNPKTKATISAINGRASEGATLEDFKRVIDNKTAEWLNDPRMEKFLCPTTLFRPSKFEGYKNQLNAGVPYGQDGSSRGNSRPYESAQQRNARKLRANLGLDASPGIGKEADRELLLGLPPGTTGAGHA